MWVVVTSEDLNQGNHHPPSRILLFTVNFESGHLFAEWTREPKCLWQSYFEIVGFFLRTWGKSLGFSDIAHFNLGNKRGIPRKLAGFTKISGTGSHLPTSLFRCFFFFFSCSQPKTWWNFDPLTHTKPTIEPYESWEGSLNWIFWVKIVFAQQLNYKVPV